MVKRAIASADKTEEPETKVGLGNDAVAQMKKGATILGGLTLLLLAVSAFMLGVEKVLKFSLKVVLAAASMLVVWILWRKISTWWRRRRNDWGVHGKLIHPRFFRVHPYVDVQEDRELYVERQLDESILQWLRNTKTPVVCLHGRPGAGKSSMLNAFVLQRLRKAHWITVVVSNYDDPAASIRKALLERGLISQQTGDVNPDALKLLREAAEFAGEKPAGEKRLFVVFDQFEGFLVKHQTPTWQSEEMKRLLESVREISNLRILLVARTADIVKLEVLGLLIPERDVNLRKLGFFTKDDAERFLQGSGLDIGFKLTERIIDQARRIEYWKTPTSEIQPVTLNMIGRYLNQNRASGNARIRVKSNMLVGYLSDCIREVGDHALPVLRVMVSSSDFKRRLSAKELAREAKSTEKSVTNVFSVLDSQGLLRQVVDLKGAWEFSHDFLGPLLNRILVGNWAKTLERFNRIAPLLVGVLVPTCLYLGFCLYGEMVERQAIDRLDIQGGKVSNVEGQRTVAFDKTPIDIDAAFRAVRLLPDVQSLVLSNIQLAEKDLEQLIGLKTLQRLDLGGCTQIGGGGLVYLSGLMALEELNLSGTRVTGQGLDGLRKLNHLQWLDLSRSEVGDDGLEYLKELTHLSVLILNSNNRISDAGLKHLRDLRALEVLDLSLTKVTDSGLEYVTALPNLVKLYVEHTQVADAGLEHLKLLTKLSELDLRYTQLTDQGLEHLAGLPDLIKLYLEGTQVSDTGLEHLKLQTKLSELDLRHTKISDLGLAQLAGLRNLVKISLDGTLVSDTGLEHLKLLSRLKELDLRHTKVTDVGLVHLIGLRDLVMLCVEGSEVSEQGINRLLLALPNLKTDIPVHKIIENGIDKGVIMP